MTLERTVRTEQTRQDAVSNRFKKVHLFAAIFVTLGSH